MDWRRAGPSTPSRTASTGMETELGYVWASLLSLRKPHSAIPQSR